MELDVIKSQTTWNDASQSINLNFAKIRQALASIGSGGGTVDALISTVYDVSNFGSISTNDNSATFNAFAIDSLYKRIKILEDEEVDFTGYATEQWVLNKSYITAAALSPYLKTSDANSTFATLVAFNALLNKTNALEGGLETLQSNHSELSNEVESLDDNLGTLSSNFNTLKGRFDALDDALSDDVSGKINTWNEIVDFLDEYNGSKDLATILSGMNADIALRLKTADFDAWKTDVYSPLATRVSTAEGNISTHTTQISGLTTRMGSAESNISTNTKGIADNKTAIATNKSNISANTTAITNLGKKVTANEGNIAEILKWFAVDADGNLYTTYNLYSTKEISANGLSTGSGSSGGGLISQVFGTTAFGTITSESNSATFNAYAIDSLYKRIVSLEGKATAVSFVPALTSGKQIGTLSIDGVSTVLYGVDAYSKADADSTFLKLSGGTLSGSVTLPQDVFVRDEGTGEAILGYSTSNNAVVIGSGSRHTKLRGGSLKFYDYVILHEGNYSQYALPLSGGTINGGLIVSRDAWATQLTLNSNTSQPGIQFKINNALKGSIVVNENAELAWILASGAYKTILHSDNYAAQIGDYYLKTSGGTIKSSTIGCPLYLANTKEDWNVIGFKGKSHSDYAYLGLGGNGNFFVTTTGWTAAYGLIHSGNIGSFKAGGLESEYLVSLDNAGYNKVFSSGFQATNRPSENYATGLTLYNTELGYTYQLAYSTTGGIFSRYKNGTTWSAWNTLIHSGNYNSYALPLSGGTISGSSSGILTINRTSGTPLISFQANGTNVGFLGIDTVSRPCFVDPVYYETSYLIHSGNIGSYAPLKKGRQSTIDLNTASNGYYEINYSSQALTNAPSELVNAALFADFRDSNGYAKMQLIAETSGNLFFRAQQGASATINSAWRTVAFTDSNVASATKLATARTIWGQSFDGTGNVTGALKTPSGYNAVTILDSYLVLGQGMAENSLPTYLDGYNVYMRYGKSSTIGFILNSSGNVTIGASDLASTNYKLYVNGNTGISGDVYIAGASQSWYDNSPTIYFARPQNVTGGQPKLAIQSIATGGGYGRSRLAILQDNTADYATLPKEVVSILPNGNVGIGTTAPAYKLDVNGDLAFKNGGSIYGRLSDGTVAQYFGLNSGNYLVMGWGSSAASCTTSIYGHNVFLGGNGSSHENHLVLNTNGNLSLASYDIAQNNAKLYIYNRSCNKSLVIDTSTRGIDISNYNDTQYVSVFGGFAPNLASGSCVSLTFGKEGSNYNSSYIRYNHNAIASTENFLSLGFWGVDNLLNIKASGNVGIGTTSPAYKLDVNGSISLGNGSTSQIYFQREYYNRFIATKEGGLFAWRVNGSSDDAMILSTSGNLLLGTNYDSGHKLDVNGTLRATGAVTMDSSLNVGTVINVGSNIMPKTNETSYLGSTSLRFLAVCAKVADFSGAVSMGSTLSVTGATTLNSTLSVAGEITAASTIKANSVICATTRLRVNATNNVNVFGFIDAAVYGTTNNVSTVHIGSCYGGASTITNTGEYPNGVSMTAISIYRGVVGIGRKFSDSELRAAYGEGVSLTTSGGLTSTGLITASSGVKVASGQAITFLDASGKEHKLTYDSTAGAFKFDGNILVVGDGQFNAIN